MLRWWRDAVPDYDVTEAWMEFCEDKNEPKVIIRAYLDERFRSQQTRPALGESETEIIQPISVVKSAISIWKSIVLMADLRVLALQRTKDPGTKHKWRLRWADISKSGAPGSGPVADISRVSLYKRH